MQCSPGGGLRAADALRAAERLRPAEGLRPAAIALPRIWSIEDSVGVAGHCMLTATTRARIRDNMHRMVCMERM